MKKEILMKTEKTKTRKVKQKAFKLANIIKLKHINTEIEQYDGITLSR